jgi:hypothetical protein
MNWWKRAKDWFSNARGRVRRLLDELPDARELIAELNAESMLVLGDAAAAFEPMDSRLLRGVMKIANLLDFVAPISGLGGDKERALLAKLKQIARAIDVADDQFDALWASTLRPELVRYIEAKKVSAPP